MCQKAMSSGAGAGARAGSGKKMLGAGAAPKQASSETLFKRPYRYPAKYSTGMQPRYKARNFLTTLFLNKYLV